MSEWISADILPEEGGTYLVCFDRTYLWKDIDEPIPNYAEPWAVNTCSFTNVPGWCVAWQTGPFTGEVAYWQSLPEPPLEMMIRDKLAGKQNFLVPSDG